MKEYRFFPCPSRNQTLQFSIFLLLVLTTLKRPRQALLQNRLLAFNLLDFLIPAFLISHHVAGDDRSSSFDRLP